jgi:ferredoxin
MRTSFENTKAFTAHLIPTMKDDDSEPPPMETLPDPDDCKLEKKESEDVSPSKEIDTLSNVKDNNEEAATQSSSPRSTIDPPQTSSSSSNNKRSEPQCIYHKHIPMTGRTTDPSLLDFDLAVQEFQQGVSLARHGNYSRAQELIGSAFLRSEKSIQHVEMLPSALLHEEYDGASIHVMEHSLFLKLLDHPHPELTVFLVMQICAGAVLGGHPEEGRRRIQIAIKSGEKLMQLYEKGHWSDEDAYFDDTNKNQEPDHDNNNDLDSFDEKKDDDDHNYHSKTITAEAVVPTPTEQSGTKRYGARNLYGTLKRWRLHRQQSALHSVVGNFLMTYTELDAALQTAPKDQPAVICQVRYDLATLCMSCQLKPLQECFTLFYQIGTDAVIHNDLFDTPCLPLCYAYMACIAAKNPATLPPSIIVTHLDAFMLMEESDRCQLRYEELHLRSHDDDDNNADPNEKGSTTTSPINLDTNSIDRLKMKMEFLKLIGDPKQIRIWKLYDRQRSLIAAHHYQQQQQQNNSNSSNEDDPEASKITPNFAFSIIKNPWTATRSTRCLVCHKIPNVAAAATSNDDTNTATETQNNNNNDSQGNCVLMKCTRCKNAFYCSKECQRNVRMTKTWLFIMITMKTVL